MTGKEKAKYKAAPLKSYGYAFKLKIVHEVECGIISKDGAKYKYGIAGNSTVLNWCRQYGKLKHEKKFTIMKKMHRKEPSAEQRIEDLEKALEKAQLKIVGLESMIQIAEKELGIEIKKKSGTKQHDS